MFAPVVVLVRQQIGQGKFNQLRGKAIALHCQTITRVCTWVGVNAKKRQELIRLPKNNGKTLGLLA